MREDKLREAERAVRDSTAAVAELREQWRVAVGADTTRDVTNLETQIDKHERNLERLKVRVPVLRDELTRSQKEAANRLYALLSVAGREYREMAASRLAVATLSAAVNGVWGSWVRANADVNGTTLGMNELFLLASAEGDVPSNNRVADRNALPDVPQQPPAAYDPPNLYPWVDKPAECAPATDAPGSGERDADRLYVVNTRSTRTMEVETVSEFKAAAGRSWYGDVSVPATIRSALDSDARQGIPRPAVLGYRVFRSGSAVPEQTLIDLTACTPARLLDDVAALLWVIRGTGFDRIEVSFWNLAAGADVASGKRLDPNDRTPPEAFAGDPLDAATRFVNAVAASLHPPTADKPSCQWACLTIEK